MQSDTSLIRRRKKHFEDPFYLGFIPWQLKAPSVQYMLNVLPRETVVSAYTRLLSNYAYSSGHLAGSDVLPVL